MSAYRINSVFRLVYRGCGSYSAILTLIVMLYLSQLASTEMFHLHRDPQDDKLLPDINLQSETDNSPLSDEHPNFNQVVNYNQCKKYLCKYGYLRFKCECNLELVRHKRSLFDDGLFPTELKATNLPSDDSANVPDAALDNENLRLYSQCTENDFITAIKTFQKNYKLEETGLCDDLTASQMSQRRCGQPDTVIDKLSSDERQTAKTTRKERSLTDIITGNRQLDRSIERRKQQLKQYMKEIEEELLTSKHTASNSRQSSEGREKRSVINVTSSLSNDDYGGLLNKRRVSWRLMSDHYSHFISPLSQRSILKQAFRYWGEVAPLCFFEDNSSPSVDIEIGFLEGVHLSCYRQFDGYGGEIAHKFFRDVHFDNSEPYTTDMTSSTAISLLLVAVHELGHVIGLNHSAVTDSVMNAIYHQSIRGEFELSDHDRNEVRAAYGACSGKFDTAFDYVRSISTGSTIPTRVYNTFFFRSDHYWMYENNNKRARFGDPLPVTPEWPGLPNNVDAFLHYFEVKLTSIGPSVYDEYYFFRGDTYYKYESNLDRVQDVGRISSKFPVNNSTGLGVPSNLDTVFFDLRDKNIYFFKGEYVYIYNYKPDAPHSCCVSKEKISTVFPAASNADKRSPSGNEYSSNIDSVYFSYYHSSLYFIKGDDIWQNTLYRLNGPARVNSMKYLGKWYDLWQFICDGDCT